ncbi:MAG: Na+/H+ antiporter NhaC [bacterium]|nr:Na+/H+ antiporter NhaC [bacterium]
MEQNGKKQPTLFISLIPVVILIAMLGFTIIGLGLDIDTGGSHIPLVLGAAVASVVAVYLGYSWKEVQDSLVKGITLALSACLILLIIGCLIGTWILSGIVPSMIYYGLKMIAPSVFLVTTCLICAVVSISTGSSWSTAGTVGVALIGIGQTMGMPPAMVAGAIISGAYFGDKMSPLSDTTNLAPATAGTDLFTHVRHMAYTGVPSLIISLIIFAVIGFQYSDGRVDPREVDVMLNTLDNTFNISPWLLFGPLLVILMVIFRIPALPALLGGAMLGAIIAGLAQGSSISEIIQASMNGYVGNSGNEMVDGLLTRGGLSSMMNTISLIFAALAFGGVMEGSGMLECIASSILKLARSVGSLVTATVLTCVGMNIIAPDQYLSIVVPGRMYRNAFTKQKLHPKNLSRLLEGSGTLSSPLVPWNTCGAFMGGVLGVSAGAYFMFAFFNLINPLICIIFGFANITMHRMTEDEERQMKETGEIQG